MRPLTIAAIVVVVLAATAFAIAHFTGQSPGAAQASDERAARSPSATLAANPRLTPTPSASPAARPARRRHTARSRAPAASRPASAAPSAGSAACTKPVFETSSHEPSAGQTFGNYYVTNDMWNANIWINGVASSGSTEVMVWTDNFHQTLGGSLQGSATLGGRGYSVYRGGSYIAFEAKSNFTAGTVNLLAIFQWIMNKGWMPANSTLGQIDHGVELVSTNGSPATFTFTKFSISTS
jgi:hypothetical protein